MAKAATPDTIKVEPTASINWPSEGGPKLTGDTKALALGKRARVIIEGSVKGFSMREYGCSIDLKPKRIHVDSVGPDGEDDDGGSMAEAIKGLNKSKKGKGY